MLDTLNHIIESENGAEAAQKRQAEVDWQQLVRDVAANKKISVERSREIRMGAGKTTDDLVAAVELIRQRSTMAAKIQAAVEISANRAGVEIAIAKVHATFHKIQIKHNADVAELRQQLQIIDQAVNQAQTAREFLIQNCPDLAINSLVSENQYREIDAQGRKWQIIAALEKLDFRTIALTLPRDADHKREIEQAKEQISHLEQMSVAIEKELADIRSERDTFIQRQIES